MYNIDDTRTTLCTGKFLEFSYLYLFKKKKMINVLELILG